MNERGGGAPERHTGRRYDALLTIDHGMPQQQNLPGIYGIIAGPE